MDEKITISEEQMEPALQEMDAKSVKIRDIFCTNEQEITEHEVSIDNNGEFLLTCECGEFIKLPGDMDKEGIDKALEDNQTENEGKVTLEALSKINDEKLKNI